MRHVVQSVALAVTALTAVAATPSAGNLVRSVSAQNEVQDQPVQADPGSVTAADRFDASWQDRMASADKQITDEQQRRIAQAQAEAAAQAAAAQAAAQQAAQQAAAQQAAQAAPPPPPSGGDESIQQIITDAFSPLGPAAVQWGLTVAQCESTYNPNAMNPSGASGLFQFMPSTFAATPQGQAGDSIWDPRASAEAAAWMYSQGRQAEWSCNP